MVKFNNRSYWMGWAIISIILCHIQYTCFDGSLFLRLLRSLFVKGEFGVEIFLFLSIIGLCYSIESHGLIKYYKNRIKRIYPMYFIFIIITFLFFKITDNRIVDLLSQITGLAVFTGNRLAEWYIPATIVIYILFPFIFYFAKYLYQKNILYCILLSILLIYGYSITKLIMTPFFARRLYLILLLSDKNRN